MTRELPKQYDPQEAQARWYRFWEESGYFNAEPNPDKKPFTIIIPPPNVTGALHLGHALNNTLQDMLIRYRRMQGFEALWMPGTDHAGIATQAVVERRMLEEEKLTRHDLGREALVNRIWKWKDDYEERILGQLKQMGCSCDWQRTRFTLDDICSCAVRHTFFKLFGDDLIYRGKRLVNWDTFLQTAVSDDEVFHEDVPGHFWTFTYPVVGSSETIAFCHHAAGNDARRYGRGVHPIRRRAASRAPDRRSRCGSRFTCGREIPMHRATRCCRWTQFRWQIGQAEVGCVKITPAHDPNDYDVGLRQQAADDQHPQSRRHAERERRRIRGEGPLQGPRPGRGRR